MFYSIDRLWISFIWPHLVGHVSCMGSMIWKIKILKYCNIVSFAKVTQYCGLIYHELYLHYWFILWTAITNTCTGLYCELQLQCWYKLWTAKAMLVYTMNCNIAILVYSVNCNCNAGINRELQKQCWFIRWTAITMLV